MDFFIRILIAFLSAFAAFIPMVGYLLLIWWMDRYVRQPLWVVIGVFLWGAFGATLMGIFGSLVLELPMSQIFGYEATDALGSIVVAPFVEEISKGCILLLIAMRMDFHNMADGVVFGAAAGLGFGMTENFLYFTSVYGAGGFFAWLQNIYVRTFYSAVMHCLCTATFGMGIGLVKFRKDIQHSWSVVLGSLAIAMAIHSFWNTCIVLGSGFRSPLLVELGFIMLPTLVLVLLIIYQISLFLEGRIIQKELQEESEIGTIPVSHVAILSSYFRRSRKDWCPSYVNQDTYITLAMKLASSRHLWKFATGNRQARLESTMKRLRQQLASLLKI